MSINAPMTPRYGAGQILTATTTSGSVTINAEKCKQLVLTNQGSQDIYFRVDIVGEAKAATTADFNLHFGAGALKTVCVTIPTDSMQVVVSAITGASTAPLHIIPVEGYL